MTWERRYSTVPPLCKNSARVCRPFESSPSWQDAWVCLAVPLGTLSAVKQDSLLDYLARRSLQHERQYSHLCHPGLVLVYFLVRLFHWFPPLGYAMLWEGIPG